jgi:hypothetical protein
MKKTLTVMMVLVGCLFIFPALAHAQVDKFLQGFLGKSEESVRPEQLTVTRLEFSPDQVPEGQRLGFRATIANTSQYSATLHLGIVHKDKIISGLKDVILKPGDNQIDFPEISYQFSGTDHCFTMDAIVDRSRTRINMAREFCANSTRAGWTLSDRRSDRDTARLQVEDIEMYPDPASPGQDITFKVRLRNDGRPIRANIRIQDRDQIVAQVENAAIPHGLTEYQFPRSQYAFQRFDTCFTVSLESERAPYPVDASSKKFCASPASWTLKPGMREHRGERGR